MCTNKVFFLFSVRFPTNIFFEFSIIKVPQTSRYEEEESSTQNGNSVKKVTDYEDEDDEPFISSSKVTRFFSHFSLVAR